MLERSLPALSEKNRWLRGNLFLFLISLGGITLSFLSYYYEFRSEEAVVKMDFEAAVNRRWTLLRESFGGVESALGSLTDFYMASDDVTRNEFHIFVQRILKQNPGLQALEWIPRVTEGKAADFINKARTDGFSDFCFKEKDPQGNLAPRSLRNEYLPVYYVEPLAGNEPALGFDLAS